MYQGGVTFSKIEGKCPRVSPLTLTGVLKTLARSKYLERARKRKRASTKRPREATPVIEEEPETEEGGGGGGGWGGGGVGGGGGGVRRLPRATSALP